MNPELIADQKKLFCLNDDPISSRQTKNPITLTLYCAVDILNQLCVRLGWDLRFAPPTPHPSLGSNAFGPITSWHGPPLRFLILPLSGCFDAVVSSRIHAFCVCHCLAFPSSSRYMPPPPPSPSLALILYFIRQHL